jgi:hypothetical protein
MQHEGLADLTLAQAQLAGDAVPRDGGIQDGAQSGFAVAHPAGPRLHLAGDTLDAALRLRDLGLDARACAGGVGAASALKMAYAGLNKGITALAAIMILAAERTGAGPALLDELTENEPALLARFAKALPDMAPKAYRWAPEMAEIADFLGPDAAGRQVFDGYAALYRTLAAEAGGSDIAALIRFAAAAQAR